MEKLRNSLIILSICALSFLPNTALSATEKRIALVIGNSAYKNAPLRNPANDATDISRALKRLGFQVNVQKDASQRKMEDSIRAFGKRLKKGGVGLFYYAGHGMQVDGRNYLIPVDARIDDPSDVKYESIDAGRVLGKMEVAGNDMNIVILDACRDNPFSRSWRSTQKGLARMDAPKGSYIAYATAPGSIAADGSGRNGTFTKSLLHHIVVPGLTLESVMKRVRKDVIDETGSKQIPWSSSSITGDFYFDPSRSIRVVSKNPSVVKPANVKNSGMKTSGQAGSSDFETRELRYAKSLFDRGKKSEAKRIVGGLLQSDDDTVLSEAMYSQIIWGFASNDREAIEKLKAYYPDFKWIATAEKAISDREMRKEMQKKAAFEAKYGKVMYQDGDDIVYESGVVYRKHYGLEWIAAPHSTESSTWEDAHNWIKSLDIAGGNWRMPNSSDVLAVWTAPGQGQPGHPIALLNTDTVFVWITHKRGKEVDRTGFCFVDSNLYRNHKSCSGKAGVMAVRDRKE